ncbi:MAG: hypothetical protein ABI665_20505 [Vicinamibacterales bacterium]
MISVPLRTRRLQKAQMAQKIQHAAPSLVLLGDGLTRIGSGDPGQSLVLGVVEVIAAVLVIGTVARGIMRLRKGKGRGNPKGLPPPADAPQTHDAHDSPVHHGLDWIDLCIGGMLVVEAYMHWHETGHVPRPTVLLAVVMLGLGLFHGRITAYAHKRRAMHVSADGISIPGRFPFMRLTLPWSDVASVDFDDGVALIVAHDGRRRRVAMADSLEPNLVRDALLAAKTHHADFQAEQAVQKTVRK